MTTKEKLEKALEALRRIKDNEVKNMFLDTYAAKVYEELTTPHTEPVEVKRWLVKYGSKEECLDHQPDFDESAGCEIIELTGTYTHPIPEPETWEGKVIAMQFCNAVCGFPAKWVGKRVVVEVI